MVVGSVVVMELGSVVVVVAGSVVAIELVVGALVVVIGIGSIHNIHNMHAVSHMCV